MSEPLSDRDAYDALHQALLVLMRCKGASVRADTALSIARGTLAVIQAGLLTAMDKAENQVLGEDEPGAGLPPAAS